MWGVACGGFSLLCPHREYILVWFLSVVLTLYVQYAIICDGDVNVRMRKERDLQWQTGLLL